MKCAMPRCENEGTVRLQLLDYCPPCVGKVIEKRTEIIKEYRGE